MIIALHWITTFVLCLTTLSLGQCSPHKLVQGEIFFQDIELQTRYGQAAQVYRSFFGEVDQHERLLQRSLSFSPSPTQRQLLDLRSDIQAIKPVDSSKGGDDAMQFLRDVPRMYTDLSSRPSEVPQVIVPVNQTVMEYVEDAIWYYLEGIYFFIGLALIFAGLSIFSCATFFCTRSFCDGCGGRQATTRYNSKQVNVCRLMVVFLLVVFFGIACYGWSANVEVSFALDALFIAFDSIANYGGEFIGLATTAYALCRDAKAQGVELQSALDSIGNLTEHRACLNTTSPLFRDMRRSVADMRLIIDTSIAGDSLQTDMTALETNLKDNINFDPWEQDLQDFYGHIPTVVPNITHLYHSWNRQSTTMNELISDPISYSSPNIPFSLNDLAGQVDLHFISCLNTSSYLDATSVDTTADPPTFAAITTTLTNYEDAIDNYLPDLTGLVYNLTLTRTDSAHLPSLSGSLSQLYDTLLIINNGTSAGLATTGGGTNSLLSSLSSLQELISRLTTQSELLIQHLSSLKTILEQEMSQEHFEYIRSSTLLIPPYPSTYLLDVMASSAKVHSVLVDSPTCDQVVADILSVQGSYYDLAGGFAAQIGDDIVAINDTFPILDCLPTVHQSLTDMNTTLLVLSNTLNTFYSSRSVTNNLIDNSIISQHIYNTSTALQGSQVDDAITDSSLYSALNASYIEFNQLSQDLAATEYSIISSEFITLNNSLSNLAALIDNPSPYLSDLSTVNNTVVAFFNTIDQVIANIININSTLHHSINERVASYYSHALLLNSTLEDNHFAQLVADTLDHVYNLTDTNQEIPEATMLTPLLNKINQFNATILSYVYNNGQASLSPVTTVLQQDCISKLNASINDYVSYSQTTTYDSVEAVPYTVSTIRDLYSTMNSFIDLSSLLSSLDTSGADQTLLLETVNTVLTSGSIRIANTTIFNSNYTIARITGLSTALVGSSIDDTINDLDIEYIMTQALLLSTESELDNIDLFIDSFPDVQKEIARAEDGMESSKDTRDRWQEHYDNYFDERDELYDLFSKYDGHRLLLFNILICLPCALMFFSFLGCASKSPPISMITALIFFPLCALFFVGGAFAMPFSFALADHCDDVRANIAKQVNGKSFTPSYFGQFLDLNNTVDMMEHIDYWFYCNADRPEMLGKLDNPAALTHDNGFNVTDLKIQVQDNGYFTPHANVLEIFDDLHDLEVDTYEFISRGVSKLECSRTEPLFYGVDYSVCTSFAPQMALSVCMYLLAACLMIPAICCSIKGFKRFNQDNWMTSYHEAKDDDDWDPNWD